MSPLGYPNLHGLTGGRINADWIAAKMLGRWRDGTPLIDRPGAGLAHARPDADPGKAAYGVDDAGAGEGPLRAQNRPKDQAGDDEGQHA